MKDIYRCPVCGNSDVRYIGRDLNGDPYCRACISFNGTKVDSSYEPNKNINLCLNYQLSDKQKNISNEILKNYVEGFDTLVHAVTGSGKTEIVYETIQYALKNNKHVGFTVPRKDVVIDLTPRIRDAFPNASVTSVYGEHNNKLNGDIIVLTTHQLYRYEKYFDLLIFDEIDAFPYKNNEILKNFFINSVRGNFIMLSATVDDETKKFIESRNGKILYLYERYHRKRIPVPQYFKIYKANSFLTTLRLLQKYMKEDKPVLIFAPTIEEGKHLFKYLSLFNSHGQVVSSKEKERSIYVDMFKAGELSYLVTSSILERGVTIKNLQVIVYHADSYIYDKNSLIQIAGRVGRKLGYEKGDVYFLAETENDSIKGAIKEIDEYNRKSSIL